MTDKTRPDPAAELKAPAVQEAHPNRHVFFLVSPPLMQEIIKRLGKLPANKVHGLLNELNKCRSIQTEVSNPLDTRKDPNG